jgi:hypothetical protein
MSTDTAQRPTRADEVRTERRRKPGSTAISGLKLHIDKDKLDPAYEYRWVNDTPGRVQQLYGQDWDKVEAKDIGDSPPGSVPTQYVGSDAGKPINAILMRKRREFYAADQKEKQAPLDAMDESIRRGVNHQQAEPELRGDIAYTPGGSNTVSR